MREDGVGVAQKKEKVVTRKSVPLHELELRLKTPVTYVLLTLSI